MMRINSLIVLMVVMLTGCTLFQGRYVETPTHNIEQETFLKQSSAYFNEAEPVIQWWTLLGDPQLNTIIQQAVAHNLDVKSAMANIDQARASLRGVEARSFPVVDGYADYTHKRSSLKGNAAVTDRTSNTYSTGFDALWELDFFGRLSQRIAQAHALNEQLKADLQAVYVSVTAEVARYYIQLRGAQQQLNIAHQHADNQKQTYTLIEKLYEGGQASNVDVTRAKGQWESTLSMIPLLESDVQTAIYRLSVLTGQEPTALYDILREPAPLPSVPMTLSVGDPEALLKRRPDIRSAYQQLEQVVSRYNLAVAEWFPKVDITGGLGFLSTSLADLGKSDALQSSIGPSITWRVFDFERVKSGVREADAAIDAAMAHYQQTVLRALEDVQSSMTRFSHEERRRYNLLQSTEANTEAVRLAHIRFEAGLDNFLDVLDAEQRQLVAQNELAQSEIQSAYYLIAVYKSLGGGWELIDVPSTTIDSLNHSIKN